MLERETEVLILVRQELFWLSYFFSLQSFYHQNSCSNWRKINESVISLIFSVIIIYSQTKNTHQSLRKSYPWFMVNSVTLKIGRHRWCRPINTLKNDCLTCMSPLFPMIVGEKFKSLEKNVIFTSRRKWNIIERSKRVLIDWIKSQIFIKGLMVCLILYFRKLTPDNSWIFLPFCRMFALGYTTWDSIIQKHTDNNLL